jgi:cathepsin A (carboxypeptidase C)
MTDMMCNYLGNERWLEQLESQYKQEFAASTSSPFTTSSGKVAGEIRSAGGAGHRAGNVTFVNIHEAGYVSSRPLPIFLSIDDFGDVL